MNYKWKYTPPALEEKAAAEALAGELGIHPILGRLLRERCIATVAEAKKFFRPQLSDLHDPFLMNDMRQAVNAINKAIGRKERILVFGDYDVDGITNADLIKAMVGREITDLFPKPEVTPGEEMLRVEGLSRTGYFKNISFSVRAGEILGLTGLVGAGRTEVVEAICGITRPDEGHVYLEGQEVHIRKPSDAMEKGIILLPEDRQKEGLIMSWGLGRNVTLPTMGKYAKYGLNNEKTERDLAKRLLEEVDTKAVDIFQPASSLSGGNQQKVVVAKWLARNSRVVIFDEPTRGIDVAAKVEIYNLMNQLKQNGIGVMFVSSEMPEVLGMSDRILVMCDGRITGEFNASEATQDKILTSATRFEQKAVS